MRRFLIFNLNIDIQSNIFGILLFIIAWLPVLIFFIIGENNQEALEIFFYRNAIGQILVVLSPISAVILWIGMIYDCLKRTFDNFYYKIFWLFLTTFTVLFGLSVYFIIVRVLNAGGSVRKECAMSY